MSDGDSNRQIIEDLLNKHGEKLTFEEAQKLNKEMTCGAHHFRKTFYRWRAKQKKLKKPPQEKTLKSKTLKTLGAKEFIIKLLGQSDGIPSYEEAYPKLFAQGFNIGAEWYRRIINEYKVKHKIAKGAVINPPKVAKKLSLKDMQEASEKVGKVIPKVEKTPEDKPPKDTVIKFGTIAEVVLKAHDLVQMCGGITAAKELIDVL